MPKPNEKMTDMSKTLTRAGQVCLGVLNTNPKVNNDAVFRSLHVRLLDTGKNGYFCCELWTILAKTTFMVLNVTVRCSTDAENRTMSIFTVENCRDGEMVADAVSGERRFFNFVPIVCKRGLSVA